MNESEFLLNKIEIIHAQNYDIKRHPLLDHLKGSIYEYTREDVEIV